MDYDLLVPDSWSRAHPTAPDGDGPVTASVTGGRRWHLLLQTPAGIPVGSQIGDLKASLQAGWCGGLSDSLRLNLNA